MSGPKGLIKWGEVIEVGNGEIWRGDRGVQSLRNGFETDQRFDRQPYKDFKSD